MQGRRTRQASLFVIVCVCVGIALIYTKAHLGQPNIAAGDTTKVNTPPIRDYRYPDLPQELILPPRKVVKLLPATDSLHGVVGWAESSLSDHALRFASVGSDKTGREGFVVLYDIGSGLYVWNYLLYARCGGPSASAWQLLSMGPVGSTSRLYDLDCVYIDRKTGKLVFGSSGGKTVRAVRIPSGPNGDRHD